MIDVVADIGTASDALVPWGPLPGRLRAHVEAEPMRPAAAEANRAKVEALYDALAPAVLGYLRAHGAPEPEDLTAEVFVHVTRDLPRFRGPDEALPRWVFAIARHRLIDDRRRRAARPRLAAIEVPEVPDPASPPHVDPELVDALRALTPLQREVVLLRFVADLPLRDVARIVHRPVGAVKALQARALARLARDLR